MEKPNSFYSWFKVSSLMQGREMKGTEAFKEFVNYTEIKNTSVSKTMFYFWIAEHAVSLGEELVCKNKKDGKYFFMPNAYEKYKKSRELNVDTYNHKQLIIITSKEFYDWVKTKYFYSGQVFYCQDLYEEYCTFYNFKMKQSLTKQMFNTFMRYTSLHLTGEFPEEGRRTKGKYMIFKKDLRG